MTLADPATLSITLTLIVTALSLLGYIARAARAAFKAIDGHLEAMRENTQAIRDLGDRVDKLEKRIG